MAWLNYSLASLKESFKQKLESNPLQILKQLILFYQNRERIIIKSIT